MFNWDYLQLFFSIALLLVGLFFVAKNYFSLRGRIEDIFFFLSLLFLLIFYLAEICVTFFDIKPHTGMYLFIESSLTTFYWLFSIYCFKQAHFKNNNIKKVINLLLFFLGIAALLLSIENNQHYFYKAVVDSPNLPAMIKFQYASFLYNVFDIQDLQDPIRTIFLAFAVLTAWLKEKKVTFLFAAAISIFLINDLTILNELFLPTPFLIFFKIEQLLENLAGVLLLIHVITEYKLRNKFRDIIYE